MPVELCHADTTDGLNLCGLILWPDASIQPTLPVDAALIVHGTASNFYAHGVLETFSTQAVACGVPVLRANTRGHDSVTNIPGENGPVRGGAAYENIVDCCLDLTAWIDWLVERGCSRIALVGHSMGAVKSIYSQAQAVHPSVACVIGISPPRFCHTLLVAGLGGDDFLQSYRQAQQLVAEGRDDELMFVRRPLPLLLTASGFLAKYGPHDEYDIVRHLPAVQCPTLIVLGTGSAATSAAFSGLPEEIERLSDRLPQLSLEIVDGANTGYTTCPTVPFELAAAWFNRC